jgi:hypothetical protein
MDLKELKCEAVERICDAQDRIQWLVIVNKIMNLWVP